VPPYIPSFPIYVAPTARITPAATPVPVAPSNAVAPYPSIAPSLAAELYKIGLFVGTGNDSLGNPVFELERPMTRLESLTLIIRLLGLEEASKSASARRFTDVPDWGIKTVEYAYDIGLTVGVNDEHSLFAPDRLVTLKEFSAFMLRVLGYMEKSNDFAYAEAVAKAIELGLFANMEIKQAAQDESYIRGNAVVTMVEALFTSLKNSDSLLIDKLVEQGAIKEEEVGPFVAAVESLTKKKYVK
jgi:hypothetical protein